MEKQLIIGLAGPARSGKDTAAGYLAATFGMDVVRFAAALKAGTKAMFDLTDDQIEGPAKDEPIDWLGITPRRIMQTLGTEWAQSLRRDIWVRTTARRIDSLRLRGIEESGHWPGAAIPDVRFDHEADWLRGQGGVIVHLVRKVEAVEAHVSEQGIRVDPSDVVILNNGTVDQLHDAIHKAVIEKLTEAA
ncbi:MAG: hypothetical protein ACOCPR_04905 [Guyparkeria sp.]